MIVATEAQKVLVLECAFRHPRDVELHLDQLGDIRDQMVQVIAKASAPYQGPLDRFITVLLGAGTKQGNSVGPHAHKGWTAVWYPFGADCLIVEGEKVEIQTDEVIVLPPGTVHEVPHTDTTRLSVAVVVATPEGAG